MAKRLFSPTMIPLQPTTERELEAALCERIGHAHQADQADVSALARLYSRTGRQAEALPYLESFTRTAEDPVEKAWGFLTLGQLMEQLGRHAQAVPHYEQGIPIAHPDWNIHYFLNNNLAFCLCELERYEEAEGYAKHAVEIDSRRHNAHKNLAIALEGQKRFVEAASSYLRATAANPRDSRALMHLEEMLSQNRSILEAVPEFQESLRSCRAPVARERDGFRGCPSAG